jgi:hypothetical protein
LNEIKTDTNQINVDEVGKELAYLSRVLSYERQIDELAQSAEDPAAFLEALTNYARYARGEE